jgi:hypothetical protein
MSDLDELFRRDPLRLTKDPNIEKMVAYYREKTIRERHRRDSSGSL